MKDSHSVQHALLVLNDSALLWTELIRFCWATQLRKVRPTFPFSFPVRSSECKHNGVNYYVTVFRKAHKTWHPVRLVSVPCLRFTWKNKAVETSNLVEIWPWTRVTGEQIWDQKILHFRSQWPNGHWERKCKIVLHIPGILIKSGSIYVKTRPQNNPQLIRHISSKTVNQRKC